MTLQRNHARCFYFNTADKKVDMRNKYIAFLRGINVGGHHKVPMVKLRQLLEKLGCQNVVTILNSGNVIFDSEVADVDALETQITTHLAETFGFPIPTILRQASTIERLLSKAPFKDIEVSKDIRLYVSFLHQQVDSGLSLPWQNADQSFQILDHIDQCLISVLDLSVSKTTKAMAVLEQYYGKDITTRNWNTIKRIEKKLM